MKKTLTTLFLTIILCCIVGIPTFAEQPVDQVAEIDDLVPLATFELVPGCPEDPQPITRGVEFYHVIEDINPREFNPLEYAYSLLKQGASQKVYFVEIKGKPYIRWSVFITIPEEELNESKYDGNISLVIQKKEVLFLVTDTSIEFQYPLCCGLD